MRGFTCLSNALGKTTIKNPMQMLRFHLVHDNLVRVHSLLRVSPAMAAGLTDILHDMEGIAGLTGDRLPRPKCPKTYRKRISKWDTIPICHF